MDSERKPGSAKSIKNFVGKIGEFKPWGVQILKTGYSYCKRYPNIMFCNFIHAGSYSIASAARDAANIKRLINYQQHSTLGILVDRDFPESVERFYSEEFKQKLAISFLD